MILIFKNVTIFLLSWYSVLSYLFGFYLLESTGHLDEVTVTTNPNSSSEGQHPALFVWVSGASFDTKPHSLHPLPTPPICSLSLNLSGFPVTVRLLWLHGPEMGIEGGLANRGGSLPQLSPREMQEG